MAEFVSAVLIATNGAVSPVKVLKMRADFACWLILGRASLNNRASASADQSTGPRSVHLSGDDSIEESMGKLSSFLRMKPGQSRGV